METIFTQAKDRLKGLGLKFTMLPIPCNVEAEGYDFETRDDALTAISELTTMVYESKEEYVHLSMELTPKHSRVQIEIGDEEWDYDTNNDD